MESPRPALTSLPCCSTESLIAALQEILSEPALLVEKREKTALHDLLAERNGQCVLFGAGSMGRRALSALRSMGVEPVAISDNNPALWNSSIEGIPVLAPKEVARQFGKFAHFFITIRNERHWFRETAEQLERLGCAHVSSAEPIAWRFPEVFPQFLLYEAPHKLYEQADCVLRAAEVWADDASREEYLAQIRLRSLGDPSGLPKPAAAESYYLDGIFNLEPGDAILDCGAFDGDTIRSIIDRQPNIGSVEAVEADSNSFSKLCAYVNGLEPTIQNKIRLHRCAVGAQRGTVRFENDGTITSKISDTGTTAVDLMPIDELCVSTPLTMIKMDIEGAEFEALRGAKGIIRRDRPILAICVYHWQQDIWRLPLFMREIVPEYRMYLKTYSGDGIQAVAFAVPPERVLSGHPTG